MGWRAKLSFARHCRNPAGAWKAARKYKNPHFTSEQLALASVLDPTIHPGLTSFPVEVLAEPDSLGHAHMFLSEATYQNEDVAMSVRRGCLCCAI